MDLRGVVFESAATALYVTPDAVADVSPQTLDLLKAGAWIGGETVANEPMSSLDLTRDEIALSVQIAVAPPRAKRPRFDTA